MAGTIKSSIRHFDGFDGCGGVGLAGNGGGSGKDGRGAAVCGASLVRAGIDTVETTFGVASTVSAGCCGGTAGGGLSPGAGRNSLLTMTDGKGARPSVARAVNGLRISSGPEKTSTLSQSG